MYALHAMNRESKRFGEIRRKSSLSSQSNLLLAVENCMMLLYFTNFEFQIVENDPDALHSQGSAVVPKAQRNEFLNFFKGFMKLRFHLNITHISWQWFQCETFKSKFDFLPTMKVPMWLILMRGKTRVVASIYRIFNLILS